jgi:hypothetical protein
MPPPVLVKASNNMPLYHDDAGVPVLPRLAAVLLGPAAVLARDPLHIAELIQTGDSEVTTLNNAHNPYTIPIIMIKVTTQQILRTPTACFRGPAAEP